MKNALDEKKIYIKDPIDQLYLYGYNKYFEEFKKLFSLKKLPNAMLLSGPKGIGKSTFIFHYINFLFSKTGNKKQSSINHQIEDQNHHAKLLSTQTHPNIFLINNNKLDEEIKIDQIRNLNNFLNKSAFLTEIKIVIIDNAEYLNKSSGNALLKSLEEKKDNTFFFIIHNNQRKILDTIKSRCLEFKIFFNKKEKEDIFRKLIDQYNLNFDSSEILNSFYFETPGNLIRYISILSKYEIMINEDIFKNIFILIDKYNIDKNDDIIPLIKVFIEKFYCELLFSKKDNSNSSFLNYSLIVNHINNMKIFNLSKKNTFLVIKNILKNEKR